MVWLGWIRVYFFYIIIDQKPVWTRLAHTFNKKIWHKHRKGRRKKAGAYKRINSLAHWKPQKDLYQRHRTLIYIGAPIYDVWRIAMYFFLRLNSLFYMMLSIFTVTSVWNTSVVNYLSWNMLWSLNPFSVPFISLHKIKLLQFRLRL